MKAQAQDIARWAANSTLEQYTHGVAWDSEKFTVKGESWIAAYLPVWLYSYLQVSGSKRQLHYVAVNGRTKETMGSVPINTRWLWIVSILFELLGIALALFLGSDLVGLEDAPRWVLLLPGVIFYVLMYMKYRNASERHAYELETKRTLANVTATDVFDQHHYALSDDKVAGCNNQKLDGRRNWQGSSLPENHLPG